MPTKYNTLHYMIAELKAYGIKHIVASPGTQNSTFNTFVQADPDFKCYSVIDERSAVYVAIGIAQELQEPVVITCTEATASRNYMSGMTEAYYREIPIIALTFYNPKIHKYSISPQYSDRSISQSDVKNISVNLPEIKDNNDKIQNLTTINAALSMAKYNRQPVHINCPSAYDYSIKTLPTDIWITKYYYENFAELKSELKNKNFAIFMGEHKKFSKSEEQAISKFAEAYNIPVYCDHTSNYHGSNKILISQYRLLKNSSLHPDLIIDMGSISCVYNKGGVFSKASCWRVIQNFRYGNRHDKNLTKLLIGSIERIFSELCTTQTTSNYYEKIKMEIDKIPNVDLPLSTTLVAQQLAKFIPNNSSLHLAILMAIQNLNFFKVNETVDMCCNVGGFGIDGPVSTAVGQSLAKSNDKVFCFTGDLAFFYDMNILGNRHISNNLRIICVNNNKGFTMRSNSHLENTWGDKLDNLVTAAGHNKNGAKGWVESCGFKYLSAYTKEDLLKQIQDFCQKDYSKPVFFEVFTTTDDEKVGAHLIANCFKSDFIPSKKLSMAEKIFSVRNEHSRGIKHKVIRVLGAKIKLKVKK